MKRMVSHFKVFACLFSLLLVCTACPSDKDTDPEPTPVPNQPNYNQEEKKISEELKTHRWMNKYFNPDVENLRIDEGRGSFYFLNDSIGVVTGYDKTIRLNILLKNVGYDFSRYISGFYYSVNGNSVTLKFPDVTNTYTFQNGELRMGNTVCTPIDLDSNDREFMNEVLPVQGKSGDVNYYLDITTNTLKVSGKGNMADYREGTQPWKGKYIKHIQIGEGVELVGKYAFHNYEYVEDIKLPSTLIIVNDYAFTHTNIKELTIPSNLSHVGMYAFDCENLESLTIPSNSQLTIIDDYAFNAPVGKYQTLTLPENVTIVGNRAFGSCLYKAVKLNEKLEHIGLGAFGGAYGKIGTITEPIVIPNSVKTIGSYAFGGTFKDIYVGSGVEEIDNLAFLGNDMSGTIKVNRKIPPVVNGSTPVYGEYGTWNLVVPKGCKSAYSKANGWDYFKYISEDSSLDGGYSSGDNSEDKSTEDQNIENILVGTSWNIIRVESWWKGELTTRDYSGTIIFEQNKKLSCPNVDVRGKKQHSGEWWVSKGKLWMFWSEEDTFTKGYLENMFGFCCSIEELKDDKMVLNNKEDGDDTYDKFYYKRSDK